MPQLNISFVVKVGVICAFSGNAKAYFRRAKCHQTVGDFDKALQDYTQASELDPSLKTSVMKEVKSIAQERKTKDSEDRQIYNKLFG